MTQLFGRLLREGAGLGLRIGQDRTAEDYAQELSGRAPDAGPALMEAARLFDLSVFSARELHITEVRAYEAAVRTGIRELLRLKRTLD